MLVVAVVAISVASLIAIGVGVGVSQTGNEEKPSGLNVITATKNKIEGEYYGSAGGIYFLSCVNGSDTNLTITTSSGQIIISARHPQDSFMVMMSMNDTYFLFMKDQPGDDFANSQGFIIPENNSQLMKSMIEKHPNKSDVVGMVDSRNADEIYQNSFERVIMGPEADLIIKAVQALGSDLNMKGSDYPSAMPFYLLAMSLAQARMSVERPQNTQPEQKGKRVRSATCESFYSSSLDRLILNCPTCPNDRCTDSRQCPTHNEEYDVDCFGMCGPGCTCWPFICGTGDDDSCCRYRGCFEHDRCCAEVGFYTWRCFKVAVEFLSGYFDCNGEFRCSLF